MDVRIYKPKRASLASLPLIVFFHGGGNITGNLDTEDAQARYFAAKTPCLLISFNYEKVTDPKVNLDWIIHKNAAPAVPWCKKRAKEIGADSTRTILCGGSSGAFISAQVAYHYMEKGEASMVTGLILLFAVAFPYTYGENGKHKDRFRAWEENGNARVPIIHRALAEYIWCE